MAYALRLRSSGKTWKDVLSAIADHLPGDVRVRVEAPEKGSKLQRAPLVLVFRERLSTRGVELLEGEGTLTLRIPSFPSAEDLSLGLQLAQLSAAALGTASLETLDGPRAPSELHGEAMGEALARAQTADNEALNTSILEGQTMELPGCMRPFFLGPRLYETLRTAGTAQAGLWEKVAAQFLHVQWVHLQGFHPSTVMGMKRGKAEFTACTWQPDRAQVLAPVDVVLVKAAAEPLRLPWAALPKVAGDRFAWLDERQVLLHAVPGAEWASVVERAELSLGTRSQLPQ
ncbi:MAG: hypothetical protein RL653_601 [Pseudomonadota bacterium]|jgi:hypothetical protein